MFVKAKHCFLVHSLLSTLSVLSLLIFPAMTLAYPSLGSPCSTCHASSIEDTAEFITEEDTIVAEVEDTTEATIEEDTIIPSTEEVDITEPTPTIEDTTTEVDITEPTPTIEETTTIPPTTTEDVIEATTEANTVKPTTVSTSDNKVAPVTTQFDFNNDGQITQDEVQALQTEFFDSADTNADGFLTNEELRVAKKTPTTLLLGYNKFGCGANFNRLDNDKDGLISKEEFVNNVPLFDKFDRDGNGIILVAELTSKKTHHHGGITYKRFHNGMSEKSYSGIGHKNKGNFIRH